MSLATHAMIPATHSITPSSSSGLTRCPRSAVRRVSPKSLNSDSARILLLSVPEMKTGPLAPQLYYFWCQSWPQRFSRFVRGRRYFLTRVICDLQRPSGVQAVSDGGRCGRPEKSLPDFTMLCMFAFHTEMLGVMKPPDFHAVRIAHSKRMFGFSSIRSAPNGLLDEKGGLPDRISSVRP